MTAEHFAKALSGTYSGQDGICILNGFLETVYSVGTASGETVGDILRSRFLRGEPLTEVWNNNSIYVSKLGDTGLYSVLIRPHVFTSDTTRSMYTVLLFMAAGSFLLSVGVAIGISSFLSKPIHVLHDAMDEVQEGNLDTHVDMERQDEFGELAENFNIMTKRISSYMEERVRREKELNETQIAMMQSQLNPHFLYNILGSIRTCQSLGKLDIADQMIANLTAFYRLTLRKSKELIPIKDELEIARLYLEMEKLCHKDNLDWEIEAEDGIENFLICKFTLQPFLENSILHGISSGTPAVFISIHVLYGDDTVVISIEDNGAGMDSETLAQLRHAIEHNVIDYEKHFGISNVSSRISNPLYGNGSVRIRSNPGNGTYVTIEFEQMEEDIDEKNNDRR